MSVSCPNVQRVRRGLPRKDHAMVCAQYGRVANGVPSCVIRPEPDTESAMIPDTESAMRADTESGT
jgi:hypothetical protein